MPEFERRRPSALLPLSGRKSRSVYSSGAQGLICSSSLPWILVLIRPNSYRFLLFFTHV
jgi:hypothetical protein